MHDISLHPHPILHIAASHTANLTVLYTLLTTVERTLRWWGGSWWIHLPLVHTPTAWPAHLVMNIEKAASFTSPLLPDLWATLHLILNKFTPRIEKDAFLRQEPISFQSQDCFPWKNTSYLSQEDMPISTEHPKSPALQMMCLEQRKCRNMQCWTMNGNHWSSIAREIQAFPTWAQRL